MELEERSSDVAPCTTKPVMESTCSQPSSCANHATDAKVSHPSRWSPEALMNELKNVLRSRQMWYIIGAGQLLSLFICGTGVTSQLLQNYNFTAPLTQLFLTYFLLGAFFGSLFAYCKGGQLLRTAIVKRGWKYLLLSIIDVQANFAVVKAYQYTTLTSVQLLDGFSIPSVMLLSRIVLKARFRAGHYIGVVVCVIGMATLIVTDYFHNYRDAGQASKSSHSQLIGDLLCLLGAFLYATSNVCEEYLVRRVEVTEFLGMLGFLGSFVCGIQIFIFERTALSDVNWASHGVSVGLLAVGFAAFQFLVYLMMPFAVRLSSAVTINLSLLTADLYSLLFGLFLFSYKFSGLYFLAFILILVGLITYTSSPAATKQVVPSVESGSGNAAPSSQERSRTENCSVNDTEVSPADGDLGGCVDDIPESSDVEHAVEDNAPLIRHPP